jgi:carbonic anhydrase
MSKDFSYQKLILANKAWVAETLNVDPHYFSKLSVQQQPEFLWIGCSDSRVPAEQVTGATPGEIFVHRNIANLVHHTDSNVMSVLQYAVDVLKVKHIIVCGHYGCGGVRAATTKQSFGLLNKWIRSIKDVCAEHQDELKTIVDPEQKIDRVVELNVEHQVMNLAKTTIVQSAWRMEQRPAIHGWVFDLRTGLIKEMISVTDASSLPEVYRFADV